MAGDKYTLDVEAKGAAKFAADLKKASSAAEEFGTDVDGLLSKVGKLGAEAGTILLTSNATQIANEIVDLITDIDKLDASDPTVDVKAERIAALTADLDTVQAKIREVNSTPVDIDTRPSVDGVNRLRDSSDQSRSVLANMAGNAAQDLGQLGGAAGTAGVAIGQLAEYATEGNISLKNLAAVAGPMLGLAVATAVVAKALGETAEKAKNTEEQIADMTKGLLDGKDAAAQFVEELEKTGKLDLRDFFGEMQDVTDELARSGVTAEQFGDAIEGGHPALIRLGEAMKAAGVDSETLGVVMSTGALAANDYEVAQQRAADISKILGDATENAATSLDRSAVATEHKAQAEADAAGVAQRSAAAAELQADAEDQAAAATDRHRDAILALADEQTAQAEAARAAVDAGFAQRDAQRQAAEAAAALTEALAAEDTTMVELGEKIDATSEAALALADADVKVAEEAARAAGVTLTQVDKTDLLNRSLLTQASTLTGPARAALVAHIAQLNGIPPEVASEILALIDQGKVAEAEARLAETSRTRTAQVNAQANTSQAEGDLNRLVRPRVVQVTASYGAGAGPGLAAGGVAGPRGGVAGEAGPEILDGRYLTAGPTYVPPGTHVTSTRQTRTILGRGHLPRYARGTGLIGSTINVAVNAAVVGNRFDVERTVAQAMRRYERRNGARR